ncbi:hypothetical protein PIB30_063898 [Stylosanthes scabra]|uniref:Secreted protein n=1 Tax=Stylosanthes scabra TaxID=79078 RepID=A0ABU6QL24_9FABA|nr:hypothetical protein [Stylosanthes scabra]
MLSSLPLHLCLASASSVLRRQFISAHFFVEAGVEFSPFLLPVFKARVSTFNLTVFHSLRQGFRAFGLPFFSPTSLPIPDIYSMRF